MNDSRAVRDWEIVEHLGDLSESSGGSRVTSVNIIKWGKNPPKIDVRDFYLKDGEMLPGKRGRCFTDEEAKELYKILQKHFALPSFEGEGEN